MKSPAELFVESLTEWPEPMVSTNLTTDDWCEVASIYSNIRINNVDGNVGLSIIGTIESQSLTIESFKGNEGLFVFAFQELSKTYDIDRIQRFHKIHKDAITKFYTACTIDQRERVEFFENIFTPKEA